MAELTFKSPGVSTREIDLSGPSRTGPVGTPAGVIGTATKGRAFVPLVFANLAEFVAEFGAIGSDKFGPMALREWFSNARAGLYLRVLGAGDGKARLDSFTAANAKGERQQAGSVLNAGFIVGEKQVDPSTGRLAHNPNAGSNVAPVQAAGRITIGGQGTAGQMITLVSKGGVAKTYQFVAEANAATGAEVSPGIVKVSNQDSGGLAADANEQVASLIAAINNTTNGHGSEAAATRLVAEAVDGSAAADIKNAAGQAGNIQILSHQAIDNNAAAVNVTITANMTGGKDGQGIPGQTHVLGCLMKEVAHAKAKTTITVATHGSALAPAGGDFAKIVGKGITLTSTDGTTKQYVIVDQNTDSPAKNTGDLIASGDQLGTGITVSATDSRIGAVAVAIPNVTSSTQQTLLAQLKLAIDNANGHNAGTADAASTRIKVTAINGKLTLDQVKFGRPGNTDVVTDITLLAVTVGNAFSGGLGELVFHEAGVGLDAATPATGVKFAPVARGIIMFASGVVPSMSASRAAVTNNTAIGQRASEEPKKATATLTVNGVITANGKFTLVSGATRLVYEARAAESPGDGHFDQDDGANATATSIAACINHTAGGRAIGITAVADANVVTLTQDTAGIAGNTIILNDCDELTVSNSSAKAKLGFFSGGTTTVGRVSANSSGVFGNLEGLDNGGSALGAVNIKDSKQEFVMLLNGHKPTSAYPNALTASFDPQATNYFANIFNTNPEALQEAGHVLYTHYDVFNSYAVPDGTDNPYLTSAGRSGISNSTQELREVGFLMKSQWTRNHSAVAYPSLEDFSDRFRTAVSPTIRSQKFGGVAQDLFKVHSLDDGAGGNAIYKITIENIRRSQSEKDRYGQFDLVVRDFNDNDREPVALERFSALSLNPQSDRYICRIIGDYRLFYDFDKRPGSQKVALTGKHPNVSNFIRIEAAIAVEERTIDPTALPFGFRGVPRLSINGEVSGNSLFADPDTASAVSIIDSSAKPHVNFRLPPVPLRRHVGVGVIPKRRSNSSFCWGIQFEADDIYTEPNKNSKHNKMMPSLTKYLPDYVTNAMKLLVRNDATADSNNNNEFSLENIQVITNASDKPESKEWAAALYRREATLSKAIVDVDGNPASTTRFLNSGTDLDLGSVRRFLKFTTYVQGGFDGVNIFDKEKSALSDVAVKRELDFPEDQGGKAGSTTATYLKSLDVLAEKSDVDIQLLAIPGIRQSLITDRAIEAVEDRFDAMYLMDTIVFDSENLPVTGSSQKVSVTNTVNRFSNRVLDTSFAAAYFPDVILQDPSTGVNVQAPPSVAVLGAFGLNDQLAHPWFAPAGFTRGAMENVLETQVKLNRDNLDALYDADINPITSFPHTEGVVVFGQKTLLRTQSSLDRVNVRRLLIEIRRRVRSVANSFIFEPNREETLARFSAQVNPILRQIQQQQGVDRFLVRIDTSTTTQTDVENNTLRGKIFLQPTRSVEFISLDFVITNAGAEI